MKEIKIQKKDKKYKREIKKGKSVIYQGEKRETDNLKRGMLWQSHWMNCWEETHKA